MPLFLLAALLGLALRVPLRRGWRGALPDRSLAWFDVAVPVASAAGQVAAQVLGAGSAATALVVASHATIASWAVSVAVRARGPMRWPGRLIAAGAVVNALAVLRYGGMPVSRSALERIGADPDLDVTRGHLAKHLIDRQGPIASVLGDVIPVPALAAVVSVGDLLIAAGITWAIAWYQRPAAAPVP